MIKLVAFDWNGTLLSDTQTVVDACNHFIEALGGKPITLKTYREKFTVPVVDFYESVGLDKSEVLKNSRRNSAIFHKYYELKVSSLRTRANAKELLSFLNKRKIESIIFSNHVTSRIAEQLKRLKIDSYFSRVLANDEIDDALKGRNKKEKLEKFIKIKFLKPQEVLIVGDSSEEVEIAREIGSKAICITHGHSTTARLKAAQPDYLVNNLKEIIEVITNLKFEI